MGHSISDTCPILSLISSHPVNVKVNSLDCFGASKLPAHLWHSTRFILFLFHNDLGATTKKIHLHLHLSLSSCELFVLVCIDSHCQVLYLIYAIAFLSNLLIPSPSSPFFLRKDDVFPWNLQMGKCWVSFFSNQKSSWLCFSLKTQKNWGLLNRLGGFQYGFCFWGRMFSSFCLGGFYRLGFQFGVFGFSEHCFSQSWTIENSWAFSGVFDLIILGRGGFQFRVSVNNHCLVLGFVICLMNWLLVPMNWLYL